MNHRPQLIKRLLRSPVLYTTIPLIPLAAAITLFITTPPQTTQAQTKIPYKLTTADSPLTPKDNQQIRRFVKPRIKAIVAANPKDLSRARQELLEPLERAGVSEHFQQAYSTVLAEQLTPAAKNPNNLVKLNTFVIAATLTGPNVVNLVTIGLNDPNPAIQYWAAKAASKIASRTQLPQPNQRTLLDALTNAITKQPTDLVFEQLLSALSVLSLPDASIQLLKSLDKRLPMLAADPAHPLGATVQSLQSIFVAVVRRSTSGQPSPPATIRHMTLVSYRYYNLMANILNDASHPPDSENQCIKLLDLANRVLPWAAAQIDSTAKLPPPIELEIAKKSWPEAQLRAEEWRRLLTTDPFNFTPTNLIPHPPAQP